MSQKVLSIRGFIRIQFTCIEVNKIYAMLSDLERELISKNVISVCENLRDKHHPYCRINQSASFFIISDA